MEMQSGARGAAFVFSREYLTTADKNNRYNGYLDMEIRRESHDALNNGRMVRWLLTRIPSIANSAPLFHTDYPVLRWLTWDRPNIISFWDSVASEMEPWQQEQYEVIPEPPVFVERDAEREEEYRQRFRKKGESIFLVKEFVFDPELFTELDWEMLQEFATFQSKWRFYAPRPRKVQDLKIATENIKRRIAWAMIAHQHLRQCQNATPISDELVEVVGRRMHIDSP